MKYFVISDIHGSELCLNKALKAYQDFKADKLIVLGDCLYHGPRNPIPEGYKPAKVAQLLNDFNGEIIAVRGNCDAEVDQMLIETDIMQTYKIIDINGLRACLTHGHIYNQEKMCPEKVDLFLNGHTHLPVLEKKNQVIFFNPGSITLPKQQNPQSFGIIDENSLAIYDFDYQIMKKLDF